MTKYSCWLRLIGLLFVVLNLSACSVAMTAYEQTQRMDLTGHTDAPTDVTWRASLKALEDLEVTVEEKSYNNEKGMIKASAGNLDFIRVHVTKITSKATRIDIQARTSPAPAFASGYDTQFARMIMDKIRQHLENSQ